MPLSIEPPYFQSGTWGDVAERKLQEDEKKLSKTVDEFMEGKIFSGFIPVMQTPLVMQLIGAAPYPVEISAKNLQTTLKGKHSNEIDAELFKQLPRAMSNPLMIFKNRYTGTSRRIVVLVDLKNRFGANIVVPLELSIDSHEKKYKINRIIDPFGRMDKNVNTPSYDWFAERVESKSVLYINKKRTSQWLRSEPPDWLLPDKSKKGLSLTIDEKKILSIRERRIFKDYR